MTRLKKVRQVLLYTLLLNIAVAVAKMIYGHTIGSISMLSDGIHSSADGASNVIGLIGIWIASQPPDESHPYGHRKFETLSTIAIAVLIFGAGTEILRKSYDRLQTPSNIEVTYVSFIVMAITLIVNIGVMLYEAKKGRELKSDFLIADSMHTKTDIFISISVVISLIAAKVGYPVIDVLAALVITVFIAKMGYSILKSAAAVLTDSARINPDEIKALAGSIEGVIECHEIRTRGNEDSVCIDLHCLVDPELTTRQSHDVAHAV
ncbi:MAG: cation transporter, partial [Nitrospirae bacterium]|nr:cation transporter [Nitrospirota bacterium]